MESKCEVVNAYTRKLTVAASSSEVDAAYDKGLRQVGKTARLPGFRPGKAPRQMVERAYGPALQDAAQTALIDATFEAALREHQIAPISRPNVQIGALTPKAACEFTCFVEVRPELKVEHTDGLSIEGPPDVDLEARLAQRFAALQQENAQIEPVTDRDTVGAQDMVVINFVGKMDGKAFAGGAGKEVQLDIEDSGYIPGFAEGLVGATVPGSRQIHVRFPEDYGAKELAGKPADFDVELLELKARRLPAVDDEFAKDLGRTDLADLQANLRQELKAEVERTAKKQREDAILVALAAANPVEVPPSMVENQVERLLQQRVSQYERMTRQKLELTDTQRDELRRENLKDAEFQVRSGLLLLATSTQLGLKVTAEEVEAEIDRRVALYPDQAEEARTTLSSAEHREDLEYTLLEEKTLAYLLEHAKVGPASPKETSTPRRPAK
jgi:trigger factor